MSFGNTGLIQFVTPKLVLNASRDGFPLRSVFTLWPFPTILAEITINPARFTLVDEI
jgi:hypothetical protein